MRTHYGPPPRPCCQFLAIPLLHLAQLLLPKLCTASNAPALCPSQMLRGASLSLLSATQITLPHPVMLVLMAIPHMYRFGWHDSYTYSKALAELAAVRASEQHGLPMLILRPTIVESAMREPAPCVLDPRVFLTHDRAEPRYFCLACVSCGIRNSCAT